MRDKETVDIAVEANNHESIKYGSAAVSYPSIIQSNFGSTACKETL
jgi:hypothetical protein